MSEQEKYDLIVIGGGPAGYAGAIRAGQLGKRVACIEMERAGGTCLNWGCIPSKALLKAAELRQAIAHADDFGMSVEGVSVDFEAVIQRSRGIADQMAKGIEFLFKKNKVDHFQGVGKIVTPGMVEISAGRDQGRFFQADRILVATGCKARRLPGIEVDGSRVMTSREALAMKSMPESIVIIGAGAIGAEFAYFLNAFGCKVTLVEMLDRVLPVEDADISSTLARSFKKQGIESRVKTKVENIKVGKKRVSMDLVSEKGTDSFDAESLLLAIGVVANTEGLFSARIAPKLDRGYLQVNERYESSIPGIYAAGDIIGPPWLAHVATYEAVNAVNGMFDHGEPRSVELFPACTYCHPQVASAGMTEAAAKEAGRDYRIGRFPFSASGKAVASGQAEGFVKLVIDNEYGELLGAHIIGADATELIGEYVLAMKHEITADAIHNTIHAHPTLSEALMEAAGAAYNEAIHI